MPVPVLVLVLLYGELYIAFGGDKKITLSLTSHTKKQLSIQDDYATF